MSRETPGKTIELASEALWRNPKVLQRARALIKQRADKADWTLPGSEVSSGVPLEDRIANEQKTRHYYAWLFMGSNIINSADPVQGARDLQETNSDLCAIINDAVKEAAQEMDLL